MNLARMTMISANDPIETQLGARLPRGGEATSPTPPPKQVAPNVWQSANGLLHTEIPRYGACWGKGDRSVEAKKAEYAAAYGGAVTGRMSSDWEKYKERNRQNFADTKAYALAQLSGYCTDDVALTEKKDFCGNLAKKAKPLGGLPLAARPLVLRCSEGYVCTQIRPDEKLASAMTRLSDLARREGRTPIEFVSNA